MKLKLKNNLSNQEYILDVRDAGSTMNYFKFDINLPNNMDDGQYEYELLDDNENIINIGIIQVGNYLPQKEIKYNNKDKIKVYNG